MAAQVSTNRRCAAGSAGEMKPAHRRWNLAGQMPLVSLILLCAATSLLTNRFLSPFNLTNILVQSSIMAVIALGMTLFIVRGGVGLPVRPTPPLSGSSSRLVILHACTPPGLSPRLLA